MLSKNGLPKYVINKCIHEFFKLKITTKLAFSKKKDPTPKKIFNRLPFSGTLSVQNSQRSEVFPSQTHG